MTVEIIEGDCLDVLRTLPAGSVHCCVTSPPYFGLRDYGVDGQIGLETTPDEFVAKLVDVFREVRRVLRDDGTCWVNLGDSYASPTKCSGGEGKSTLTGTPAKGNGQKFTQRRFDMNGIQSKNLLGIPWRVAFALQADGWYLRQDIIWHKPNPMPESVRDRCTKAHEYLFLLSKSPRYYWNADAMQERAVTSERGIARAKVTGRGQQPSSAAYMGGSQRDNSGGFPQRDKKNPVRNRRSVWSITTKPFKGAHFATFPPDLIEPCVLAGCPPGGTVIDPFGGAGTTGLVAHRHGRDAVMIELNPAYAEMARQRIGAPEPAPADSLFVRGLIG